MTSFLIKKYTLNLPIKYFAYAMAKCATEVIKREGFWGYYDFAEQCKDFNMRKFLYDWERYGLSEENIYA